MVGRGGKLNAVRKMSEIKLEEATSPSYPTLKAGSVWIVIKSRKVQLNRSKEDGGCREKTQWEGAAEIWESTVRGKGLLCFLPRRSNNIFWSPALCASLLCRCQNTHNRQGCVPAKHANSLPTDPLPHPQCPSTWIDFYPKNYHCPDCASVYGQCGFVSSVLGAGCRE